MSSKLLTSDNPLLSRPTLGAQETLDQAAEGTKSRMLHSEINFTSCLPENVAVYVERGLADNTRRAYRADLAHFEAWGGCVPATDMMVACYLAEYAERLSVPTLVRRLASISKAHTAKGLTNSTRSELVKATMQGIKRRLGTAQNQAKPLMRDDLFLVLERIGDDIKGTRDCALLLLGFAGGFRRSELVALNVQDIEHVRQGMIVHLRRSKIDQEGVGRKVGIPFGRTRWCPVAAVERWLSQSASEEGPLFRPVNKHGHISSGRLSGEAVALILRKRLTAAKISSTGYSGHSLRAGFATSAAMAGAATWKIRQQTGHASDNMLARYIRDGDIFHDNAVGRLL